MKTLEELRRIEKRLRVAREVEAPRACSVCGQRMMIRLTCNEDVIGLMRWMYGRELIQVALPHWTPQMREVLISGTHPACWEQLFGGDDQ